MKKYVVKKVMNYIIKNHPEYTKEEQEEIEYGIISIYLVITKSIAIISFALILGIWREFFLFLIIYNIIRMPSFGLHAPKSWICLVGSTLLFILLPIVCNHIIITYPIKWILGTLGIILMFKNSPADTEKKPIINRQRRMTYKLLSGLLAIIYVLIAIITRNELLSNCLIIGLLLQCIMTSPMIYHLFHIPYNNYKTYLVKHPELST